MPTLYDISSVEEAIDLSDVEAARLTYAEEIFSWTDAYSETYGDTAADGVSREQLRNLRSIGKLWVRYASMEQRLKQWKKAVQVYEDALVDPIASSCLEVHLAYAAFCRARKKISNAQKVYVRSLASTCPLHAPPFRPVQVRLETPSNHGLHTIAAADLLWIQFLQMMREATADLKLEQLYSMLSNQVSGGPNASSLVKPTSFATIEDIAPTISEERFEALVESFISGESDGDSSGDTSAEVVGDSSQSEEDRRSAPIHSVEESVKGDATRESPHAGTSQEAFPSAPLVLDDLDDLSKLDPSGGSETTLRSLMSKYSERPTLLFSAPHKEPLMSGFANLDTTLLDDIKRFVSENGVINEENLDNDSLAQFLSLLAKSKPGNFIGRVLDVLEGLWTCQALKESHFDKWFNELLEQHRKQEEELRRNQYEEEFSMRSSGSSSTSLDILKNKHENDLRALRIYSGLQLDLLNANVNRTLCLLRHEQHRALQQMNFPYSHEFESELMYGFYCQKSHSLGKNEEDGLEAADSARFEHMHSSLLRLRVIIGALLSLRVSLSQDGRDPESEARKRKRDGIPMERTSSFGSSTSSLAAGVSPRRARSMSGDEGTDVSSSGKKKKKRRKLVEAPEQYTSLFRQSSGGRYSGARAADRSAPYYSAPSLSVDPSPVHAAVERFPIAPGLTHSAPTLLKKPPARQSLPAASDSEPASKPKPSNLAKIAALLASKKGSGGSNS